MNTHSSGTGLQLRSLVKRNGELELSLVSVPIPVPEPDEVLVRVEASPINPSDQGLMFGAADMSTARHAGTTANPVLTAKIPETRMRSMSGRVDQSMPVGNEGAGLTDAVRQASVALVALPLAPHVESLNVAVAAGILLYELRP